MPWGHSSSGEVRQSRRRRAAGAATRPGAPSTASRRAPRTSHARSRRRTAAGRAPRRAARASASGGSRRGRCRRARSSSPSAATHADGSDLVAASVMRRCAIRPIEVVDGDLGRLVRPPDHDGGVGQQQAGDEALEVRLPASPNARRVMTSLAPASPPTRICGVEPRVGVASPLPIMSTMTRIGCSREASLAASMTSSIAPSRREDDERQHAAERDGAALLAHVDERPRDLARRWCRADRRSRAPPGASVAGEHLVRGCRAPRAGRVLLERSALRRPRTPRSGRGSSRRARPPRGAGTAAGRRAARRG